VATRVMKRAVLDVPGPRRTPLIGRMRAVYGIVQDAIGMQRELFRDYGPIVSIAAGGGTRTFSSQPVCPGTVTLYGPELLRQVRTQHNTFHQQPLTGMIHAHRADTARLSTLNTFLVSLWGVQADEHRRQRRLMMPGFHGKRINSYRDDMVAITDSVLSAWKIGAPISVVHEMKIIALRIATKTLFGEDVGGEGASTGHLLEEAVGQLAKPLTTLLPYDLPGMPFRRLLDMAARYENEMRKIIARRAASGDTGDVLSMLLEARDEETGTALTEEEVVSHAGALFAAGHETTANSLAWTLLILSQHPKIAADLVDELDGVLHGAAPTIEQLENLPLLEYVIKESMRVIPVVPNVYRSPSEDVEVGGYVLPAGTEIMTSTYYTHHMPELYAEPEKFNPQRWETINPTPYEYSPFSAGPRMCIGATFAMLEMKIVLAMLMQRFRLELPPAQTINREGFVTMSPTGGLPMTVHAPDRQFERGVGGVMGNVREMVELRD
jgi:cytochrome P450